MEMVMKNTARKYYEENVPDLVEERAGIDDVILMMTGGEKR